MKRVFLCYRQTDGRETAQWLYEGLRGRAVASDSLSVYFDTTAAAVEDWTSVHHEAMEGADALVIVVTPGLLSDFGEKDWVHKELRFWLRNRRTAPLLVETTGDGDRWVPPPIKRRWPNIQRVELRLDELERMGEADRAVARERILGRLVDGIAVSEATREAAAKARRARLALVVAGGLAVALVGAGMPAGIGAWRRAQEQATALQRENFDLRQRLAEANTRRLSADDRERLAAVKKSNPEKFGRTGQPNLWPLGGTLRVRFLDGTNEQRQSVKDAFAEWLQYANLHVQYTDDRKAPIRVSFRGTEGSWSMLGTQVLARASDSEPTLNLGYAESAGPALPGARGIPRNYLHEVGHVIGLVHEWSNPDSHLRWDRPAVYRLLEGPPNSWSRAQVDANIFEQPSYPGARPFDRQSIMLFDMPAEYFLDHIALRQGVTLSESDKRYVASLYPADPK